MSPERAAELVHDVGKYVARIARNVPPSGPVPPSLVPLLAKDLYELPGGLRASQRFEQLLDTAPPPEPLEALRVTFRTIDELEVAVRRGDQAACRRACELALEVESTLRAWAAEVS